MTRIDLEASRAYLSALAGAPDAVVTFQTFSDRKPKPVPRGWKDPLARILHGSIDQHARVLEDLNLRGAGVFLMVAEGDLRGRSAENVRALRAVFTDNDGTPRKTEALPPSFTVESANGPHTYFRLRAGVDLEAFTPAQERLAAYYGTDASVTDLPRVMRVPGFLHQKGEPFLVTFRPGSDRSYDLEEIVEAHPVDTTPISATAPPHNADAVHREKLVGIVRAKAAGRLWVEPNRHKSAKTTAAHARKLGLEDEDIRTIVVDFLTRAGKDEQEAEDLAEWAIRNVATPEGTAADGDSPGRDPACAAQLIAIGRRALLFSDERGDGYAAFTDSSVRRVLKVRGSDFAGELSRRFAQAHGYQKAANGEAIASARNVLEALARHEGEAHRLNTRFAQHEGAVWIDMADPRWRAIKVTAAGWEIVETPPLLFRRYPHMQPLPEPVRGGDLSKLFEPFAMGEAERVLLAAHVVVSTIAGIPRPVLIVHGPQGAGKSTLLKRELAVLDPTGIDDLDLSGEPRELAQLLDQHGVSFFDNVVKVPDAAARMLCKASTGGGFEKRKLYTDEESVILTFKRAVLISAINIPTHAPDLLDRCLLIGLDRIPPERRRREEEMSRDFEAARPSILGGLLDALSGAMRVYPTLDLPELPRMADFAAWGAAAAEALGLRVGGRTGADAFLAAYTENVGRQTEEVLESDPVARAVRDFVNERGTWEGTASDLLAALKVRNEEEVKSKDGGWPKRADGLSRRLEVLHSTLADAGVTLRRSREGKNRTRKLTLSRAVEKREDASAPSAVSADAQPDLFPARVDLTYDGDGLPRATWHPGTCPVVEDEEAPVPGALVRCGRPLAAGSSRCREHAGAFRPAVAAAEVRA